ncbi:MAG: LCP family protein [Oscillospiraceae bacterium]|nr:LCP family protein [Oscillospiraceae bacterium]
MGGDLGYRAKYFALSFGAASLVFVLFFYMMLSGAPTGGNTAAPVSLLQPAEVYQPSETDSLTLLVFGSERMNTPADTFVLLRFDPVGGVVGVAAFPPQTVIVSAGREETLADAFRLGGAVYTRDALAACLNIPIDRFARVSLSGFVTAAAAVGSVAFELSEPITLADGDLAVTLNAGPQLLDGRQVAALIRHTGYPEGELGRASMTAQLVAAIIDQRIDIVNSTLIDRIFETVINLLDTDFTFSDYIRRQNGARLMADSGQPIARIVELAGTFSEDGSRFELADTTRTALTMRFL